MSPWLYWLVGLLLLVPIWLPPYFPTEDGLAHLYWIEVYRVLGDPAHSFHQYFARHLSWDTPYHLLHFGLQYGLATILEPHLAQKVVVSIVILSWAGAVQFLSLSVSREITLGALVTLLLVHSSWLYNGYFAFLGAMPLAMIALGVLIRLEARATGAPAWPYYGWLVCLGVAAYYAHYFVAALILLLAALWLVYPWRPLRFRRLHLVLAMTPTAALVGWYLLFGTFGGTGGMRWESPLRAAARFFGLAFFRGFAPPDPAFWMALAAFALVVAALCWTVVQARWFAGVTAGRRFVLFLSVVLAVAFFFAPAAMGEALNFNSRLQFAMWAWLLPTLPYHLSPRLRAVLLGTTGVLVGWQVLSFSLRGLRFSREYAGVIQQAQAIPRGATLESVLVYENTRYEGSFLHVLASVPEDIAYRRRAALLSSFFVRHTNDSTSSSPASQPMLYWVVPRQSAGIAPQYRLDLQRAERGLDLIVQPVSKAP